MAKRVSRGTAHSPRNVKRQKKRPSIEANGAEVRKVSSLLLSLPAEIRNMIWIEVLGGRMIHVTSKSMHRLPGPDSTPPPEFYDEGYRKCKRRCNHKAHPDITIYHGICTATKTDRQSFDHYMSLENNPTSWEQHHSHCAVQYGTEDRQRLELQLLRTCRQIYDEATPLLWSTITFSFGSLSHLEDFLKVISDDQAMAMKHLRLGLRMADGGTKRWIPDFSKIVGLRGLKSFNLCIDQAMKNPVSYHIWKMYDSRPTDWFTALMQLQSLPLEVVTVILEDSGIERFREEVPGLEMFRWTIEEKKKFATYVRDKLLHPDGVKLAKKERRIAKKEGRKARKPPHRR